MEIRPLEYRPDIEGLRAVAILLVVAAHAGVPWLAGGFVGVDVFFVLSGYLITGLLLQEFQATGRVRFLAFYARRLRRLLPALLLMIYGTMILATLLLAPYEQVGQAQTAQFAVLWASNLYFAFSQFDYFAPTAHTNLFLHTWSLGVEEQFYLLWPLLLLALLSLGRGRHAPEMTLRRLRRAMGLIVILGFLCALILSYTAPLWAFYLMPARAWQFAIGAWVFLVAPHELRHLDPTRLDRLSKFGGWLGLGLILAAAAWLDTQHPYPGVWVLLPTLGATLLLVAGRFTPTQHVPRFLALPPLQAIGRVSYAWYLWHWPILLLGGSVPVIAATPWATPTLIGLSLLLATLSYFAVEKPIRSSRYLAQRSGLTLFAAGVLMLGMGLLNHSSQRLAIAEAKAPSQYRYATASADAPAIYALGCDQWFHSAEVRPCSLGAATAPRTALLIGDSIAGQWFPTLAEIYHKPGWRLLVLTKSSCPLVDDAPYFYERIGQEYTVCTLWRKAALALIKAIRPDVVFMGSARTYPFDAAQWTAGTAQVLAQFANTVQAVYILRATPHLATRGPACLARRDWQLAILATPDTCVTPYDASETAKVIDSIRQAATRYTHVHILDMNPSICPQNRCGAEQAGLITFRDSQHLSARYAATLSGAMAAQIAPDVLP